MNSRLHFVFERTLFYAFGPPGAGKGTLYKRGLKIHEHASCVGYFSVGDEIRRLQKERDNTALEMKKWTDKGKLVPDKLIQMIISGLIKHHCAADILVIDGLPRCLSQIDMGQELARQHEYHRTIVSHIDTPEEVCINRVMERKDGRSDDGNHQVAIERIQTFKRETLPILSLLRQRHEYVVFKGEHMQRDAVHYGQALIGMVHRMIQS